MRRAGGVLAALVTLTAITFIPSCSDHRPTTDTGNKRGADAAVFVVDVNGRPVDCVSVQSAEGIGVSCDWGSR